MKLVRAVIREDKLVDVLDALVRAGYTGATVFRDVGGMGGESGVVKIRGRTYEALLPRAVVEVAVEDGEVEKVVKTIMEAARTGHVGDGRIFVLGVEGAWRIRSGEKLG
ncbi:P-II family nitrogen regulator [Pyrobaculum neutrophilum]|uniref:Nitrogen regulatory protein P-II n=1 Tax=Pyrobaculum neutrophilum (strain DSM 2338 / JCM 9278 / NBRC 100436 / V24Sta) TaxID=444157 RepID=B1YCF5_PYRNV|nr:P-II family nitrogen regulator [Pyrobaculum neutrophilum]ACB39468.1 nitrogen regulatory protein P-II [Pyrobaculum neutrophilum V24Sta]